MSEETTTTSEVNNEEAAGNEETQSSTTEDTTTTESSEESTTEEKAASVVPEEYDLTLTKDSLLDDSVIDEIATEAREQGLSNDQAQAVVKGREKAVADHVAAEKATLAEAQKTWREDAEKDKEIGGDDFKKNVELAHRVIDKYGNPAFKEMLNKTGVGDNPDFLRLFVKLGKSMADDVAINPGSQNPKKATRMADRMYGKTTPAQQ